MHPILFRIPLPEVRPCRWAGSAHRRAPWSSLALACGSSSRRTNAGRGDRGVVVGVAGRRSAFACKRRPSRCELGPIPIYSYGVMLGLSLVVGWYLTLGLAERDGLPKETMANYYVVTAIAAVVGSRVLYILTNLDEFDTFGSMFAMRRGGLVAYGGFLGGFVGLATSSCAGTRSRCCPGPTSPCRASPRG